MIAAAEISPTELSARVGEELGVSDWVEVSQPLINLFANATMDRQFIHVDPERARTSPFGGTIAHGFLLLSLLSNMSFEALPKIANTEMVVNYGFNKQRFLVPVKAGERVRSRFVLREVTSKSADQLLIAYDVALEVEGGRKPALVAEWLALMVLGRSANA
jgi:acyl dehydratase